MTVKRPVNLALRKTAVETRLERIMEYRGNRDIEHTIYTSIHYTPVYNVIKSLEGYIKNW